MGPAYIPRETSGTSDEVCPRGSNVSANKECCSQCSQNTADLHGLPCLASQAHLIIYNETHLELRHRVSKRVLHRSWRAPYLRGRLVCVTSCRLVAWPHQTTRAKALRTTTTHHVPRRWTACTGSDLNALQDIPRHRESRFVGTQTTLRQVTSPAAAQLRYTHDAQIHSDS